ncbi:MAG: hypothetical protein LVQ96_04380 [Thermoplasmatales archaeon]|nr:hypothetical protein [Thermoplasmatales archaeon]MCW6170391.1 hypothetical protein [Thermoplasmatales archaeon]
MDKNIELISQFILEKLHTSSEVKINWSYPIPVGEREIRIDLAIESEDTIILVKIEPRIGEDAIYRIYALSHLMKMHLFGRKRVRSVCLGKSIDYSTQELAAKLEVETLLIPSRLYQYLFPKTIAYSSITSLERPKTTPLRTTSEKAWKIVCSLLIDKSYSILEISKKIRVSYGWTNAIVHKLADSGIVTSGYGFQISDLDKLFNVVSWERTLNGQLLETIRTNFNTATQCMNEVALNLNKLGVNYAFTAHSSAILYGSSIMREDTAYIYLRDSSDIDILRTYSGEQTSGCDLKVYLPDRDVMKSSTMFNGIKVVDVCQNILDLAGLGMEGRTAAKDLVSNIGR